MLERARIAEEEAKKALAAAEAARKRKLESLKKK